MLRRHLPILVLILAISNGHAQEPSCEWKNVARIVAVGDVHGDHGQLVKCLVSAGVIDKDNKWIADKTHLVQTGDILDRGPDSRQALDLLMDLEQQAKAAGGQVHALIGNHEAMILAGDCRYLHVDEPAGYGGKEAFVEAMSPQGKYGLWIRSNQAVIKINDILFVHGGISPAYAKMSLQEVNAAVRRSLGLAPATGAAGDDDGPLWYRGLADEGEEALGKPIERLFANYSIKHIVIGHTVVRTGSITVKGDCAVIMIDVGMSRTYRRGPAMCLLIEHGKFFSVSDKEKKALAQQPQPDGRN